MTAEVEVEICVLGGGPAGAVAARRLAELGHDTVLVDRTARAGPLRSESLAPAILPILESLRLRDIVDAAVFQQEARALLLWQSESAEEKALDAPALLVERTYFDGLLRTAARSCGVRVMAPAAARSPRRLPAGGWIVPVVSPNGATVIETKFLVDARGKRRRAWLDDGAPRTAAISAAWMDADRSFRETRIEAGADEWFWGSPLPDGGYAATIFLDAVRLAGLATKARMELYRSLLARSKLLGGLLRSKLASPPWVRDATSGIAENLIGHDFIRLGEAAVSIDPLSSQGVQAAMLSAIQGSAAVHTLLAADYDSSPAIEFYQERRNAAFRQASSHAARLYGDCNRKSSFWLGRSSQGGGATVAMQRARQYAIPRPRRLSVSPALEIVEVPVLAGTLITRAPALRHPALDHPIAYLGGISLVPLIGEIDKPSTPDQIVRRWARRMPVKTAMDILNWMWAASVLVPHADDAAGRVSRVDGVEISCPTSQNLA